MEHRSRWLQVGTAVCLYGVFYGCIPWMTNYWSMLILFMAYGMVGKFASIGWLVLILCICRHLSMGRVIKILKKDNLVLCFVSDPTIAVINENPLNSYRPQTGESPHPESKGQYSSLETHTMAHCPPIITFSFCANLKYSGICACI